jgi:hypothetical protein
MHKGIIFIGKGTANEVYNIAIEELNQHKFWDWYDFGGRWKEFLTDAPLSKCLELVKEYANDYKELANRFMGIETTYDYTKGYNLIMAGNLLCQNLFEYTNIYNLETGDYSIPEDTEDWYAVMIDVHF